MPGEQDIHNLKRPDQFLDQASAHPVSAAFVDKYGAAISLVGGRSSHRPIPGCLSGIFLLAFDTLTGRFKPSSSIPAIVCSSDPTFITPHSALVDQPGMARPTRRVPECRICPTYLMVYCNCWFGQAGSDFSQNIQLLFTVFLTWAILGEVQPKYQDGAPSPPELVAKSNTQSSFEYEHP